MKTIVFTPIGSLISNDKDKADLPRQPIFSNSKAVIRLNKGCNFEEGLKDLEGFERLWVIFHFDKNSSWKPLVDPPINCDGKKKGVFSTRSPYRPNGIGISVVNILKIDGLDIHIEKSDMIDGTPILDIKPYIPRSDSFPQSRFGWVESAESNKFTIKFTGDVESKIAFLEKRGIFLKNRIFTQLEYDPFNSKKKRVERSGSQYILKIGTWRVCFGNIEKEIFISDIGSGYTKSEICDDSDKYGDKDIHKDFLDSFLISN
ncbi:MAG: tRNA (N6-threonylcarbamoyladenosine(37)-N6)-methyltransferase TrmO [Candidatus Cloacimonadota bacterium]|nr:MAG: tRNA (N6-threonylcarbamoyladenosine(37)-N6)-methyltransferase TrmO [Candidatus Cloacimonadota bacterium]PIE77859.1 MAG: tRNA (N6-threonylcarbamoyladenosine(37)-N6)-methyltransferase TrmO [Candidatus Delongbacteria bacterium]